MSEAVLCNYTIEGSGPPLFLVHGIGSSLHGWREVVEGLEDRFTASAMTCAVMANRPNRRRPTR